MDRLAAHVIATAVLTAALAAVPTAMAANPTAPDPSPKPTASVTASATTTATGNAARSTTVTASTVRAPSSSPSPVPSPSSSPSPSEAVPAAPLKRNSAEAVPCSDARQVGGTSYAHWHGIVSFSVKLYYSPKCHDMYGYAYPWLQFRLLKVHYDLGMGVFDVTHDAIDGARTFIGGAGGPDFWSSPVALPSGTCTEGLAHVFYPDTETDTFTTKICV